MDIDQLQKTVEWLDQERRNDKRTIAELQKSVAQLEGALEKATKHINEMSGELTDLKVGSERMDGFDNALVKHREMVKQQLDEQEKKIDRRERELNQSRNKEINDLINGLAKIRADFESVEKMRVELRQMSENETQFFRQVNEFNNKLGELEKQGSDQEQTIHSLEEDNRRLPDMQGEISTLRKRADEMRAKHELITENHGKLDNRVQELISAENHRLDVQNQFLDNLKVKRDEMELTFKNWGKTFEQYEKKSMQLEEFLANIGETERKVKLAQESFEAISEQLGRRINEITEMQRLGEERFRQEWSTFKSDDQKRWTNYSLTQEEQHKEITRQLEKLGERVTGLADNLEEIQDIVQFISEKTEQRMQALLTTLREWTTETERFMSSVR
jgi:chromosome segregation ATPase